MHISFSEWAISFKKVPLLHLVCLYGCKALGQGRKGLRYHLMQALISVRPLSSGFTLHKSTLSAGLWHQMNEWMNECKVCRLRMPDHEVWCSVQEKRWNLNVGPNVSQGAVWSFFHAYRVVVSMWGAERSISLDIFRVFCLSWGNNFHNCHNTYSNMERIYFYFYFFERNFTCVPFVK